MIFNSSLGTLFNNFTLLLKYRFLFKRAKRTLFVDLTSCYIYKVVKNVKQRTIIQYIIMNVYIMFISTDWLWPVIN